MPFFRRLLVLIGLGWLAYLLVEEDRRRGSIDGIQDFETRLAAQAGADAPSEDAFVQALDAMIEQARSKGANHVDVNAGRLHRGVGGYPGPSNRMSGCCRAMRAALRRGDMVLIEPKSGLGATLTMRYFLDEKAG